MLWYVMSISLRILIDDLRNDDLIDITVILIFDMLVIKSDSWFSVRSYD